MRTYLYSSILLIVGSAASLCAQITSDEALYLRDAAKLAPMSGVQQDEIIHFDADVTGDGTPEAFYTKASLRDGKQGHVWSAYQKTDQGGLRLLGDVTFSALAFAPSVWKADPKIQGFYCFGPAGAGRGSLSFYEVNASGINRREFRMIVPKGADKEEFDALFAARLTHQVPGFELHRTLIPKQQDASPDPKKSPMEPSGPRQDPTSGEPATVGSPAGSGVAVGSPATPAAKHTSSTVWSMVAALIAAGACLWLLALKRRK